MNKILEFIKKQGIGTWISLATVLLSVIALIIYGAALKTGMNLDIASGSQPFYEAIRPEDAEMMSMVVTCGILALVFTVGAMVLGQFKFEGILGKVCTFLTGAMRIVAPALLVVTLLYFVYGSFTGLGWTFFSNEELAIYPQAIKVGKTVITGLVFFGIAAVAGIVASFFKMVKKEETEEVAA